MFDFIPKKYNEFICKMGLYFLITKHNLYKFMCNVEKSLCKFIDHVIDKPFPIKVYKVIVYDECSEDRKIVTEQFLNGQNYTETEFEDYRIEYRYIWKDIKYRYVTYYSFTKPFIDISYLCHKKKPFKQKIISAFLKRDLEIKEDDVTNKIRKYAGPQQDFFKNPFRPRWIFPSEDFTQGEVLTTITSHGEIEHINMSGESFIRFI